jgi:signal transduction histidine kinase
MQHSTLKKPITLQSRFLLGLAAILLLFAAVASVLIYYYQQRALEKEIYEKTELVMTTMDANQSYVREVLRPKMYTLLGDDQFILEAMSTSYISRNVMERFSTALDNFSYRRVAINARNPDYEANQLEQKMIHYFTDNPEMEEWHGIVETDSEKHFVRFQPVYTEESCTHCHGDPALAPKEVVHQYGNERGFHRTPGNIYGVISVAVPIDINLSKIKEIAFSVFIGVIPSIVFLYIVISLFFNRVIVQNLSYMLSIFRSNLQDDSKTLYQPSSHSTDEISELTKVAKNMSSALHQNRLKLESFANEILLAKERLQSVFDGITDPVVLIDNQQKIRVVNQAFLRRYNLALEDILECDIQTNMHSAVDCPLARCSDILQRLPTEPVSKQITTRTGEIFLIYFYPILNEENQPESIVCYLKDITSQKQLENKIQQTEKMVSLGQLAAGVAHEINNPLGVILCHVELLEEENTLSEEAASDLQIIKKHAGNCQKIVADLLNFSRRRSSIKTRYSINDLIREVVSISANQLQQQDIAIDLELDRNIPRMNLDIDRLKQVILNLIINGAQAIENGGSVNISTHYCGKGESITIIVEDDGTGIPPECVEKIFDPFFTTKSPGFGTGLGLSVSYGIIQDHGGNISVDTKSGQYSRFIITLPAGENLDEYNPPAE